MDTNGQKSKETRYFLYLLRGVAIFVLTLLIKTVTNIQVIAISQNEDIMRSQSATTLSIFYAVAILGVWLIYGTATYVLSLYDKDAADRFFARHVSEVRFVEEIRHIVRSPEFLLETGVSVLLSLFASLLGGFFETERLLAVAGLEDQTLRILITTVVNLGALILISLFQRYEIHRYWRDLKRIGDTDKLRSPLRMGIHLSALLLYPLVYPYALLPVYIVLTFAGIASVFLEAYGLAGLITALILIALFSFIIPRYKRRRAKDKFLKKLATVAAESGYILENITATDLDGHRRPQFSLEKDGKVFYFRFFDTLRRGTPLYFTSDHEGYFLHRLGTKKHHVSLSHRFEYGFDITTPGDKLLVIIRYPKRVYAQSDNATRPLVGGDKLWDYTVFEPETLIAHVDRKCLGRYRGMFD